MRLETEIINSAPRLSELKSDWSALARGIPQLTPFQLPEWMITWWRHFGSGELHTLVFRCGGRMVGLFPAFVHRWHAQRQMTLIGSGISDYLDPIIDPNFCGDVIEALREHLESNSNWDLCNWQDLSENTPLRDIQLSPGFELAVENDTECSALTLEGTVEEFWSTRPRHLRRNVSRYRRQAESSYALNFEAANEAIPELLEGLIQLHSARWHMQGEPGMIEANRSARFLREIAQEFAGLDMLRLFALRFDNEIAAVIAAWQYRGSLYFYLAGFDPRFAHFSPGQILLFECMRHSYEQHCRRWNFLRGLEAYKFAWGAQAIPKCRVRITHQSESRRKEAAAAC